MARKKLVILHSNDLHGDFLPKHENRPVPVRTEGGDSIRQLPDGTEEQDDPGNCPLSRTLLQPKKLHSVLLSLIRGSITR